MMKRSDLWGVLRASADKHLHHMMQFFPVVFCFIFVCACAWGAYLEISYNAGRDLVVEVRQGYSPVNWSNRRAQRISNGLEEFPASCNWLHQDISFTLSLAILDRTLSTTSDYEQRIQLFQKNLERAVHGIGCAPLRQRFWISYSQLHAVASFEPEKLEDMIGFMRALSPLQQWDVRQRVDAYMSMPGQEYLATMKPVQKDIASLLRYGSAGHGIRAIKKFQEQGAKIEPILAELDLASREKLKKFGIE